LLSSVVIVNLTKDPIPLFYETEPADFTQALSTMQSNKNGQKCFAKAEGDSGDKWSLSGKGGENHTRSRGMDKDLPGLQLLKTLSLTQISCPNTI